MKLVAAVLIALAAVPAAAQYSYDTAVADHGQAQLQNVLAKRRLQQAQARHRGTSESRARATCANKKRVAAGLSSAKARQLYALCAQAGY